MGMAFESNRKRIGIFVVSPVVSIRGAGMTNVFCPMGECEHNIDGLCSKQKIKLIVNRWDDIECRDYKEDEVRE